MSDQNDPAWGQDECRDPMPPEILSPLEVALNERDEWRERCNILSASLVEHKKFFENAKEKLEIEEANAAQLFERLGYANLQVSELRKKLALAVLSNAHQYIKDGLRSSEVCIPREDAELFQPEKYVISEWEDLAARGFRIRVEEVKHV